MSRKNIVAVCCIFLVFFCGQGNFVSFLRFELGVVGSNQLIILLSSVVFLTIHAKKLVLSRRECSSLSLFVTFIVFVGGSTAYSQEPLLSLIRFSGFLVTTVVALVLARTYSLALVTRLLIIALLATVIISVLLALIVPSIGVATTLEKHEGYWNGIFGQKNALGRASFLLFFASSFYYVIYERAPRYLYFAFFAVLVGIMSGSRTAQGMMLIFTLSLFLFSFHERLRSPRLTIMLVIFAGLVGLTYISLTDQIVGGWVTGTSRDYVDILGVSIPLEGRLTIWEYSITKTFAQGRELFGYGYDGFWGASPDSQLRSSVGLGSYQPEDAHNGFVDLFLQLGLFGLLFYLLVHIKHLQFIIFQGSRDLRVFCAAFAVVFLVYNLTESYTLKATNTVQFLMSYLVFMSARMPRVAFQDNNRKI